MTHKEQMTPIARELRDHLEEHSDLVMAMTIAQTLANACIDRINRLGPQVGTNMLAQVLIANALLCTAAEWWASGNDSRVTVDVAMEAMRSFLFELPEGLTGESYDQTAEGVKP